MWKKEKLLRQIYYFYALSNYVLSVMASSNKEDFRFNKDDFRFSGLSQVTQRVNWGNEHHQRIIIGCLVNGVYILEGDRQNAGQALAPAWWKSFHFELYGDPFIDEKDESIYGAIFKFNGPPAENAPKYVIAFRGTLLKMDSRWEDLKNDSKIVGNSFHRSSRVEAAIEYVSSNFPKDADNYKDVWLAGHSQGASTALLVGIEMIDKKGFYMETFLFNPPFIPSALGLLWIKNQRLRSVLLVLNGYVRAALAILAKSLLGMKHPQDESLIEKLSLWEPNLFVNPEDIISKEYIGYFKHRSQMKNIGGIGADEFWRIAAMTSMRSLFFNLFGKDSEPLQVIPTANLITNTLESTFTLDSAHQLQQWWSPDCQTKRDSYKWNEKNQ